MANIIIDVEPPVTMQPDSISWQPPNKKGNDGKSSPVLGPTWRCSLGFSVLTWMYYQAWFTAWDGALHNITLPHPATGEMETYSCYVESITPRLVTKGCQAAAAGVDISLSRILVV